MNRPNLAPEAGKMSRKANRSLASLSLDVGGKKWIVPYSDMDSLTILQNPGTWVIFALAFAVLPLNQSVPGHEDLSLFVMSYSASAWAAYFYVLVAKRRTNLWLGLSAAVFTIVAGIPFGRLLKYTVLSPFYQMNSSPHDIVRLIGTVGSHGLAEELLKAMPLVLMAFVLKRIKSPIDGVFFGALSGLGFAAWEGYKYMLSPDAGGILMDALVRSTALPFLHAAFAGISGYFIALAVRSRRPVWLCALGIGIASMIHGCYDFLTSTPSLVMAVVVYLLFTGYADRSQQQLRQPNATPGAQLKPAETSQVATG